MLKKETHAEINFRCFGGKSKKRWTKKGGEKKPKAVVSQFKFATAWHEKGGKNWLKKKSERATPETEEERMTQT